MEFDQNLLLIWCKTDINQHDYAAFFNLWADLDKRNQYIAWILKFFQFHSNLLQTFEFSEQSFCRLLDIIYVPDILLTIIFSEHCIQVGLHSYEH